MLLAACWFLSPAGGAVHLFRFSSVVHFWTLVEGASRARLKKEKMLRYVEIHLQKSENYIKAEQEKHILYFIQYGICRFGQALSKKYMIVVISADTAENGPFKVRERSRVST